jgi:hypothetical protein
LVCAYSILAIHDCSAYLYEDRRVPGWVTGYVRRFWQAR